MTYLEEVETREKAASKGPWKAQTKGLYKHSPQVDGPDFTVVGIRVMGAPRASYATAEEDADFIAHAREDVPRLMKMVERIKEMIWLGINLPPTEYDYEWRLKARTLLVEMQEEK